MKSGGGALIISRLRIHQVAREGRGSVDFPGARSENPGLMSEPAYPPLSIERDGPFRPASLSRLETPFLHSLHAYQGICPWSPDGSRLLYAGFDAPGEPACIVARDLRTGRDHFLGRTGRCDFHTAAYQQWILGGNAVVYRDERAEGSRGSTVVDLEGNSTFYPRLHIRQVTADGRHGYGYSMEGQISAMRVDFTSGEVRTYFTVAEAAACLPPEIAEECAWSFSHFVPNAQGTRAFIKISKPDPHRKRPGRMNDWGALLVYDLLAGTFLCLGDRISGHPQWMPDGERLLNIMQPLDGSDNRWLVTQDARTGEVRRLVDFPIEGAGHPVISPDHRWLATDAYPANRSECPIYLVELTTGRLAEIARLLHSTRLKEVYDPRTIFRANPHPVWSPDSRRLLVNLNGDGERLGMALLEDFLVG
jgi:hypothetical protein